jgi:hypothetical protein
VFGSKGTLLGGNTDYQMKYIEDFGAYPERPVVRGFLKNDAGDPVYCSEKLEFVEVSEPVKGTSFDAAVENYYKMLYNTILLGQPLVITPEQAAKVIGVIETCHAQNPLPVKYL